MDSVGYIASFLVLLTFYMKRMIPLRIVALFSNAAFLTYGIGMHLMPVALLHCALIPINVHRLVLALRDDRILRHPAFWRHPVRQVPNEMRDRGLGLTASADPGAPPSNAAHHPRRERREGDIRRDMRPYPATTDGGAQA
jgi:hypothetical protein